MGVQSSLGLSDGSGIFLNIDMMCIDLRINLLVVEPNYLPDSEVLAFSRVYTP
jgi:hypothetical protein